MLRINATQTVAGCPGSFQNGSQTKTWSRTTLAPQFVLGSLHLSTLGLIGVPPSKVEPKGCPWSSQKGMKGKRCTPFWGSFWSLASSEANLFAQSSQGALRCPFVDLGCARAPKNIPNSSPESSFRAFLGPLGYPRESEGFQARNGAPKK